jgi:hypothetical protein
MRVNLLCPGIDTALQVQDLKETSLPENPGCL